MKRYIAIFLALCLILITAGCKKQDFPAETVSTTAPTTQTIVDDNYTVEQIPMVAVSLPAVTQTDYASDGEAVFHYSYQNISLIVPDPEVADKVILDFLNRTDFQEQADQLLIAAQNAYEADKQYWHPYTVQINYTPMRVDQAVLSLTGYQAVHTGEVHPVTNYNSYNYDILTGEILHLSDILSPDVKMDGIAGMVTDILAQQEKDIYISAGYSETVFDRFTKPVDDDWDWYFSNDGLCFYFEPYDIAPYGSGVITARIPYDSLSGILKDEYFPREADVVKGEVAGMVFAEELTQFTQLAEIVVNKGSDKVLLYTNGHVQNLRIISGSWSADAKNFTAENTIFATDNLTPGDAIMVEANLSGSLPELMLQYDSNGSCTDVFITLDRTNNIVKLIQ